MKEELYKLLKDFVSGYHQASSTASQWLEPLMAVADAGDPAFHDLQEIVGPGHLMPQDLLPKARSVICYFIPFVREIGRSNGPDKFCSDIWAHAYLETNQLIADLNEVIISHLLILGYKSASIPATHNFDVETLRSDWSHRHIGVIAGLGNLGLNRMLITARGCCGRLGSLITEAPLPANKRLKYPACLYKYSMRCKRCLKNCASQALQEIFFDPFTCYEILLQNAAFHHAKGFVDACGKCVCHLPCSFFDPVAKILAKEEARA